jgi:hypothetical protein
VVFDLFVHNSDKPDYLHTTLLKIAICALCLFVHCATFDSSSVTMGLDEQKEEREVLDSIFPDEITGTSTSIAPGLPGCSPVPSTFGVLLVIDESNFFLPSWHGVFARRLSPEEANRML